MDIKKLLPICKFNKSKGEFSFSILDTITFTVVTFLLFLGIRGAYEYYNNTLFTGEETPEIRFEVIEGIFLMLTISVGCVASYVINRTSSIIKNINEDNIDSIDVFAYKMRIPVFVSGILLLLINFILYQYSPSIEWFHVVYIGYFSYVSIFKVYSVNNMITVGYNIHGSEEEGQ